MRTAEKGLAFPRRPDTLGAIYGKPSNNKPCKSSRSLRSSDRGRKGHIVDRDNQGRRIASSRRVGMSRLGVLRLASLIIGAAFIFAACEAAEDGEGGQEAADEAGAEPENEDGDELGLTGDQHLRVSFGADGYVTSEDNMKSLAMYPLNAGVCETLVRVTENYGLEPQLATEWEALDDQTYRFSLREGVTFHDGQPLDAEAVQASFEYLAQEPAAGERLGLTADSVEVVDDMTIDIHLEEPNARFIEQIVHPSLSVVAPGSDPLEDQNPVCTGPFEFVEYEEERQLVVERYEDYWGEPAKLERMTFEFIPDDTTRFLELQASDLDMIHTTEHAIATDMDEAAGIQVMPAPPGQVMLVAFLLRGNDYEAATEEEEVRRAIAHAIDRETYAEQVLEGWAEVSPTSAPRSILGDHADLVQGIPHDPDRAEELLEEAGWTVGPDGVRQRDGEPLEATIIYHPDRLTLTTPQYVQDQLERVGFDVQIDQLETAAYSDRRSSAQNYEIVIWASNQNDANPAFLMDLMWHSEAPVDFGEYWQPGPDTEFDRLVDEAMTTTDIDEARRLSAEAMRELLEEEVAVMTLAGTYRIWGAQEAVEGFDPHASGHNQTWNTVRLTE